MIPSVTGRVDLLVGLINILHEIHCTQFFFLPPSLVLPLLPEHESMRYQTPTMIISVVPRAFANSYKSLTVRPSVAAPLNPSLRALLTGFANQQRLGAVQ